jgi:hypothetical protein
MTEENEVDRPDAEVEPERILLPLPYVIEERGLRDELVRLNGTWASGRLSVISIPRPGGGWIFLSGQKTLFSNFAERAFVMGEDNARRLVERCPTVLEGAKVIFKV